MAYRRVVSDLNWPVYYRWVMGHMGHLGQNLMGYVDLGQTILTHCQLRVTLMTLYRCLIK